MLPPEALGGRGRRGGAILGLTLAFRLLHVNMVPIDTDIRACKGVVLRPKAKEGEPFLPGKAEGEVVLLLRICTAASLVRRDCEKKNEEKGIRS